MARARDRDPVPEAVGLLQQRLGYVFHRGDLLPLALTHRSWCAENDGYESNERLEFLGDAVLGLVVTDHIFAHYPALAEGELAKVRAAVVSAVALRDVAERLDLGSALRLGRGEEGTGGRAKPSILADATEAVLGAVYLDGGLSAAAGVIMALFGERVQEAATNPGLRDYKTRLQELAARQFEVPPAYLVVEAGPDHAKWFHATVSVAGVPRGEGQGKSKKQAQQAAARAAWAALARVQSGGGAEPSDDPVPGPPPTAGPAPAPPLAGGNGAVGGYDHSPPARTSPGQPSEVVAHDNGP
jgi:ribonuclease-3